VAEPLAPAAATPERLRAAVLELRGSWKQPARIAGM